MIIGYFVAKPTDKGKGRDGSAHLFADFDAMGMYFPTDAMPMLLNEANANAAIKTYNDVFPDLVSVPVSVPD